MCTHREYRWDSSIVGIWTEILLVIPISFFKKIFIFTCIYACMYVHMYVCTYVCLCGFMCTVCVQVPTEARRRCPKDLAGGCELPYCVLRTDLQSSVRAVCSLGSSLQLQISSFILVGFLCSYNVSILSHRYKNSKFSKIGNILSKM